MKHDDNPNALDPTIAERARLVRLKWDDQTTTLRQKGITIYMDEVAFNEAGNQITLTKRRMTPPNAHDM